MSTEEKEVIAKKLSERYGGIWKWDVGWQYFKCEDTGAKVTKYQLDTKQVEL